MSGDDEALVKEARRGSRLAFETLVRRHQSLVRNFLRRLCAGDAALADDLSQETFLMVYRRLSDFQGRGAFKGWLCRIAYMQFLQEKRSSKAARARDDAVGKETETFAPDDAASAEARMDLDRILKDLSPEQRAVMALCFGEGMSHSEAAEALNMPLGTVKSHIKRGREKALAALAA